MTDKRRELAERWKAEKVQQSLEYAFRSGANWHRHNCANADYKAKKAIAAVEYAEKAMNFSHPAILDAEGDAGAASLPQRLRAAGYTRRPTTREIASDKDPKPVRSGVVSDEQCREFLFKLPLYCSATPIDLLRAALTHFAKSQGESHV